VIYLPKRTRMGSDTSTLTLRKCSTFWLRIGHHSRLAPLGRRRTERWNTSNNLTDPSLLPTRPLLSPPLSWVTPAFLSPHALSLLPHPSFPAQDPRSPPTSTRPDHKPTVNDLPLLLLTQPLPTRALSSQQQLLCPHLLFSHHPSPSTLIPPSSTRLRPQPKPTSLPSLTHTATKPTFHL
jgi:hypothetical protein